MPTTKELLNEELAANRQQLIDNGADEQAIDAYIELGTGDDDLSDFEESYQGKFNSDEDFAKNMADETTAINNKEYHDWPFYCIDWEWAARELMMDYSEQNGFYFRNL